MTELDLNEIRASLKMKHESQGISKSMAMKLMQELEETRAKWRKEWGRAEKATDALAKVCEVHRRTYVNEVDEAWGLDPICAECGVEFPCETRKLYIAWLREVV